VIVYVQFSSVGAGMVWGGWLYGARLLFFVSATTNKRHHHHLLFILGSNLDGVGQERGLWGGGRKEQLQLWRGVGGGCVLAGTRLPSAAGDCVPPSLQIQPDTHILVDCLPAPYSPFCRRVHSPIAFSGPMSGPPPSPPRPLPSHMHTGWMVSATKTQTSSAPSQDCPSNCICRCSRMRARLPLHILLLHTQVSR
jgi:hypothetical protein